MKKLASLSVLMILFIIIGCFTMPVSAETGYSGTVYYVDSENGSSSNSGTSPNSALKTMLNVSSLALKPGDAVLFKRGCTWTGRGLTVKSSGEKGKQITFSCYGDQNEELPTIISADSNSATAIIYVNNKSYITIDSLRVIGNYSSAAGVAGIKVEAANGDTCYGNVIRNCVVEGVAENWNSSAGNAFIGISVMPLNYWGFFDGVTVENNEIYNCKARGISVNGCYGGCDENGVVNSKAAKNIVIRNNYLNNIGTDGILVNNCNSPLVEYNTCNYSHSYAKTTWHVAMWPFACYSALFQYNESFNTQTTYDGQGFDCDYQSYYTTFQYNYSHDNTGGFMLICTEPLTWDKKVAFNVGVTVRYNISQNDKHHIFCLTCHITDTKIYNNTIYSDKGVDNIVYVYSRDGIKMPINTKFYNNIFYTNSGVFDWQKAKGTEFKNNLIYGSNSSLYPKNDSEGGSSDIIEASGNIISDPLFVKAGGAGIGRKSCFNYKLKEGSPAFSSGITIEDESNMFDFFGNAVSQTEKPNIGAYNGKAYEPVKGDVNSDGKIDIIDALMLTMYLANESSVNIDLKAANINSDEIIDAKDLLQLKKYLANIINEL